MSPQRGRRKAGLAGRRRIESSSFRRSAGARRSCRRIPRACAWGSIPTPPSEAADFGFGSFNNRRFRAAFAYFRRYRCLTTWASSFPFNAKACRSVCRG